MKARARYNLRGCKNPDFTRITPEDTACTVDRADRTVEISAYSNKARVTVALTLRNAHILHGQLAREIRTLEAMG